MEGRILIHKKRKCTQMEKKKGKGRKDMMSKFKANI